MFTSINKRSALCLYFDEVSAILQALHIRALLSMSSGKMKLIVARDMLKPIYFACVETMLEFFVCKLHILHPGSRGPSSKHLRWNKPVDIESFFSSALCASLTGLRRESTVSIRKKYTLEPRVHILLNHEHIRQDQQAKESRWYCFATRHFDKGRPCGKPSCKSLVSGRACSCKKDPCYPS